MIEIGQVFQKAGIKYDVIGFDGTRYTLKDQVIGATIVISEYDIETKRFIPVKQTVKQPPQKTLSVDDDGNDVWIVGY